MNLIEDKDIVTLETAKLIKEKGYQEEELHYYFNEELLQHPNRLYYNFNQDNPPLNQYSAPYQAFLQKWLREKHNIHIEIGCNGDEYYVNSISYTLEEKYIYDQDLDTIGFKTYEEALELGLQEALKLI